MTKRQSAKYKIDRRLGENIWGRSKSPVIKRPYRPGQGGASRRRGKLSDFGIQLSAKQKLKAYYGGLSETQMKGVVIKAANQKGDAVENIVVLLKSRLQTVVYMAKMAKTLDAARQLISHGHVRVNGKRVKSRGYVIRPGDVVSLDDRLRAAAITLEAMQDPEREVPAYLGFDTASTSVTYLHAPKLMDVPFPTSMDIDSVIGYYSRH